MLRVRLAILLLCTTLMAAHADTLPKYEMRAVWLTTNWGLDWPSAPARNPREAARQQQELRNMLDALAYMGFNTIFFQARIRGEVFYPSAYEPWSRIVSGTAGNHLDTTRSHLSSKNATTEAWNAMHGWLPYRPET